MRGFDEVLLSAAALIIFPIMAYEILLDVWHEIIVPVILMLPWVGH